MANKKRFLPVIPLRELIIFPNIVFYFDVVRKKSMQAIEEAISSDGLLFLVSQKDYEIEEPTGKDIYAYGTVAKVRQVVRHSEGGMRILVEGVSRGKCDCKFYSELFYESLVTFINSSDRNLTKDEYSAYLKQIHTLLGEYAEQNPKITKEHFFKALPFSNPSALSDALAGNLIIDYEEKQTLLETTNVKKRLIRLIEIMSREVNILRIENKIASRVKHQMDEHNRDYYLREQLKAIKNELGEDSLSEVSELREKIEKLNLPKDVYIKARKELSNFERLPISSPEATISRHYLEVICEIPWGIHSDTCTDLILAKSVLERDHYGMEKVKERVLEHLAVMKLTETTGSNVICLLGAPGVGKTSVAKSIAEATGRKYVRICLGGMRDEAEIRGHRKTYVGAMPGRIVDALRQAKTSNPLILLDEIDKLGSDYKGDPSSALLEILDTEQNSKFRDNFLEVGLDLSNVLFIATANTTETIPKPLLDRLEVIELSSYTDEEKLNIATKYLLPKQLERHGLKKSTLRISEKTIEHIIRNYTRESGVRNLERELSSLCRKCAMKIADGAKSLSVSTSNITTLLGAPKYTDASNNSIWIAGIANGLAWTSVGGEVLQCEVSILEGTGKLQLTGKLGDVMKESAQTAVSYIRSISEKIGIDADFYIKKDIHIHFPEGAVPKDGPSAGITIATAVASALTKRKARSNFAMTGELSLTGRVLPIGGLREKALAAYRFGISDVIVPKENTKDFIDIPEKVIQSITFHPVSCCSDVLDLVLSPANF